MKGELKAFWNVGGGDWAFNLRQAITHGFEPADLCNTYSDYWGKPRTDIRPVRDNPWGKPDGFETIVKRNTAKRSGKGSILVQDIEFDLEDKADKAWANAEVRTASGVTTKEAFREAYYREWATWYSLPCKWAKEAYPGRPVHLEIEGHHTEIYHVLSGNATPKQLPSN
jgi:hypothetical protein